MVVLCSILASGMTFPSCAAATNTATLGINYGMVADDLPPPSQVAKILKSISVSETRIYTANSSVLQAFANTGISIIVGIDNGVVASLTDAQIATNWVQENVANYLPNTQISGLAVGNEVYTGSDTALMANLLPAMRNLYSALVSLNLENQVMVSTAHSLAVLSSSYPPSGGVFVSAIASSYLMPLLQFLSQTGAPFMINCYPFFAYKANPTSVSLQYVLFQSNSGVTDPNTGLVYYNMLEAQVDAIYSALQALGYTNLEVVVSETGWPSAGDPDEAGATVENAQAYNSNLIQLLESNKGTPHRPDVPLKAYIFALFNEDLKPGPTSERNYGLFKPDGTQAYDFGMNYPMSYTLYTITSSSSPRNAPNLLFCLLGLFFHIIVFVVMDQSSTIFTISSLRRDRARIVSNEIGRAHV